MMSGKYSFSDIFYFLQGEWRNFLYYGIGPEWLSERVRLQYEERVLKVQLFSPDCINDGTCQHCGCVTPDVFFADKACGDRCYGKMANRSEWCLSYKISVLHDTEELKKALIEENAMSLQTKEEKDETATTES